MQSIEGDIPRDEFTYDGEPDPPLGVLGQLHDGWQQRLTDHTRTRSVTAGIRSWPKFRIRDSLTRTLGYFQKNL